MILPISLSERCTIFDRMKRKYHLLYSGAAGSYVHPGGGGPLNIHSRETIKGLGGGGTWEAISWRVKNKIGIGTAKGIRPLGMRLGPQPAI